MPRKQKEIKFEIEIKPKVPTFKSIEAEKRFNEWLLKKTIEKVLERETAGKTIK